MSTIITRKIEIYVNEDDKDLRDEYYKLFRDYEYYTYKYANEIIQLNYFKDTVKRGIGLGTKNEISNKEVNEKVSELFGCSERNVGYKFITKEFKDNLPSSIRGALNSEVYKQYNNERGEFLCGKRSIRTFKRGLPSPFMKSGMTSLTKQDDNKFSFNLFGVPFLTKLGRDRSDNETIIDRVLNGTYSMCDSSFQFKGNKLFLSLVLKIPIEKHKLDRSKVLGIDLGINVPLYASLNKGKNSLAIGNRDDFLNKRIAFQKRKQELQRSLKFTKGGKGRKHKLKPLDTLRDKESRWVTTYNHKLSKMVIEFALTNKCSIIHLENLKGIGKRVNGFLLRNWSYFQLQTMIEQKGGKHGITVLKINAEYTSQRCFSCGYIDKDNRKKQSEFICTSCGHEDNADHNAAKNISVANTKDFKNNVEEHKRSLKNCEV